MEKPIKANAWLCRSGSNERLRGEFSDSIQFLSYLTIGEKSANIEKRCHQFMQEDFAQIGTQIPSPCKTDVRISSSVALTNMNLPPVRKSFSKMFRLSVNL